MGTVLFTCIFNRSIQYGCLLLNRARARARTRARTRARARYTRAKMFYCIKTKQPSSIRLTCLHGLKQDCTHVDHN